MSDDQVVVQPIPVPGMQINFQSPIGPSGKTIAFLLSAEVGIEEADLNRRLDVIASAARRQDAFEQLRLYQNALVQSRKNLPKARARKQALEVERRGVRARLDASTVPEIVPNRRVRQVDATAVASGEIQRLATLDLDIGKADVEIQGIEAQIDDCLERIPFFKAILRGEEPLDLDELKPAMAAE